MTGENRPRIHPDLAELLRSFNDHDVKYLIAGAVAVGFHAQPRYTKDLDVFIKPDPDNAAAAYRALAAFGAPLDGISEQDLADRNKFFRFGHPPDAVDLMPELRGVDFDTAWERRVVVFLDESKTLQCTVLSAEDTIASKLASGRPYDLADADAIRRANKTK